MALLSCGVSVLLAFFFVCVPASFLGPRLRGQSYHSRAQDNKASGQCLPNLVLSRLGPSSVSQPRLTPEVIAEPCQFWHSVVGKVMVLALGSTYVRVQEGTDAKERYRRMHGGLPTVLELDSLGGRKAWLASGPVCTRMMLADSLKTEAFCNDSPRALVSPSPSMKRVAVELW